MPVQDYNINTRNEVAGTLYGISYTNSERWSGRAGTVIQIGASVKPSANGKPRNVDAGVSADGNIFGIALRTINKEQRTYPGDGVIQFAVGEELAFVREGTMNITVAGTAATDMGAPVYVNTTTGEFAAEDVDAADGVWVQANNARWNSVTAAGKVGLLTLTIGRQFDAVAAP